MKFLNVCTFIVLLVGFFVGSLITSGPFSPWKCRLLRICPEYEIGGTVAPGFEALRDAFAIEFQNYESLASQLVVFKDGQPIVDLYGRLSNVDNYNHDSLQMVFSSTKTLTPIVVALMVERGYLDYYSPISKYWPEFAQNGKEAITVAELLRHEAGLDTFDEPIPMSVFLDQNNEADPIHSRIARSKPVFPKNTKRAYHAITRGLILNQLVQRVDPAGRSIGVIFDEEVRKPLNLSCWIGLPKSEFYRYYPDEESPFVYTLFTMLIPYFLGTVDPYVKQYLDIFASEDSFAKNRPYMKLDDGSTDITLAHFVTRPEALMTESPSSNGICNARSLGVALGVLANGGEWNGIKILEKSTVDAMLKITTPPTYDAWLMLTTLFTDGGLAYRMCSQFTLNWYGWAGWGGSVAQFLPEKKLVYTYTMTGMGDGLLGDKRAYRIFHLLDKYFANE